MTTSLDTIRYHSGIAGEEVADMVDSLEQEVSTLREQVEKLTEECVVLRASARSKFETIATLEQQVEKLTKERDDLRSRRCEVCGYLEHEREHTGCLREQLTALAEQNEKLRKVLLRLACLGNGDQYGNSIGNCIAQEALSLPDLATPVLNKYRAEGMRIAAELVEAHHTWITNVAAGKLLRAKADELENSNG